MTTLVCMHTVTIDMYTCQCVHSLVRLPKVVLQQNYKIRTMSEPAPTQLCVWSAVCATVLCASTATHKAEQVQSICCNVNILKTCVSRHIQSSGCWRQPCAKRVAWSEIDPFAGACSHELHCMHTIELFLINSSCRSKDVTWQICLNFQSCCINGSF